MFSDRMQCYRDFGLTEGIVDVDAIRKGRNGLSRRQVFKLTVQEKVVGATRCETKERDTGKREDTSRFRARV